MPLVQQDLWVRREINRLKQALPALAMRGRLVNHLQKSQFVIVEGQTGSGKSTQLPQYLAAMPEISGQVHPHLASAAATCLLLRGTYML